MECEHDEVNDDCQNERKLDDDDDDDAPLLLLATTETTATVVVQPSCDNNNRTISTTTTTTNQHPTSTPDNNEVAATTTTNPSGNRKTRRRNETKNSRQNDAYHTAYQNFRYQCVYFTYHNHNHKIEAGSLLLSKAIIEYHIHQPTTTTTTTTTTTIRPIPTPPPPPGTPLCYFKASYLVRRSSTCSIVDHDDDDAVNKRTTIADMIVHQHVNGLCVVCVANPTAIRQQLQQQPDEGTFHYHVSVTSSELSLAQKRKRNTKQLQGKKNDPHHHHHDGLVQPCDMLATWTRRSNTTTTGSNAAVTRIRFPCCVMGSILELNERFRTDNHNDDEPWWSLLESDPYGTGYLAIILPSGPFPPPPPS
jgi:hypothetical protein